MIPRGAIPSREDDVLRWTIDEPAPARIAVGGGSAVPISGWCFHRDREIRKLRLLVAGKRAPIVAQHMPRPDVHTVLCGSEARAGHAYGSGFYAVLPLPGVTRPQTLEIGLEAALSGPPLRLEWRRARRVVDRIELTPDLGAEPNRSLAGARIVICMATHNPDYELFARQIESISEQSVDGWRCLISDDRSRPDAFDRIESLLAGDQRFVIDRSLRRIGAYGNFERALASVGPDAEFVALADQDDYWYPNKLEALVDALGDGALLAYSDCRIVRPDGALQDETFFPRRANNWRDLRSLVIANTVTGAATMIRRELLDDALPFPPYVAGAFHDHWLACVALSLGEIAYVERPLWDYVQHGRNVLGHAVGQRLEIHDQRGEWILHHRVIYKHLLMRTLAIACALELRLGERMTSEKRRELELIASLDRSPLALARLLRSAASEQPQTSTTLGLERELLGGLLWRRRMARAGRRGNRLGDMRFSSSLKEPPRTTIAPEQIAGIAQLREKTTPLRLKPSESAPQRVNVLVGEGSGDGLDPVNAAIVNLAAALGTAGTNVRLVTFTESEQLPSEWPAWTDSPAIARIELHASDRSQPLDVSPRDLFVATTWWTARLAHAAARELGDQRFLYLLRDDEAAASSDALSAWQWDETLGLPHFALFSTEPVRNHFRTHGLGVYEHGVEAGDAASVCFDDAIEHPPAPELDELNARLSRRLLVYAPLGCGGRSMPDVAVLGLERVAEQGLLDGWEVNGLGVDAGTRVVELARGVELVMIDERATTPWPDLVRRHDVGLALAATARPSLASLQMAAAGLVTITNTSGTKTRSWIEERSSNLIAVAPTPDGIVEGLRIATARAGDSEARVAGSPVRWPATWAETFAPPVVQGLVDLLAARVS
jgi:glycosyltransferase involved in cell wall biosynthesis